MQDTRVTYVPEKDERPGLRPGPFFLVLARASRARRAAAHRDRLKQSHPDDTLGKRTYQTKRPQELDRLCEKGNQADNRHKSYRHCQRHLSVNCFNGVPQRNRPKKQKSKIPLSRDKLRHQHKARISRNAHGSQKNTPVIHCHHGQLPEVVDLILLLYA